jgi:hypothetical protein
VGGVDWSGQGDVVAVICLLLVLGTARFLYVPLLQAKHREAI